MRKFFLLSRDERWAITVPGDKNQTITFAVNHFIDSGKIAIQDHDHFYVALSGGSTPKAIFEKLSKPPYSEMLNWNKVSLFWSDERSVSSTHKDSNYHMAMESGLKNLLIPFEQIHRMIAETKIKENAEKYEDLIKNTLKEKPFDLIMLGMGPDGHTASLFPNTLALKERERWVVSNEVPQKNTTRMTMSYPCINSAQNIVIYVIGDSKKKMLASLLLSKEPSKSLPIYKIGTREHKALWIVDENAGQIFLEDAKQK